MIINFACKETEKLFNTGESIKFNAIVNIALRKLDLLNSAESIQDLRSPPANHLEKLKGDRQGQYSIRINDQYRICFTWKDKSASKVEIIDYH